MTSGPRSDGGSLCVCVLDGDDASLESLTGRDNTLLQWDGNICFSRRHLRPSRPLQLSFFTELVFPVGLSYYPRFLVGVMQIHLTLVVCDWLLRTYALCLLSVIVVNNLGGCLADGLAGISEVLIAS